MPLETYVCTNILCQRKNTFDVLGEPETLIMRTCPGCSDDKDDKVEFVRSIEAKEHHFYHPKKDEKK